jgi:tellurite methyltransferase
MLSVDMNDLRRRWDARWRQKVLQADWQVDPWLEKALPHLGPGRALDVACGLGRNALWLSEQGYDVTAVDLSQEALEQLRREASHRQVDIKLLATDLETATPVLPEGPFDLIIDIFYLHRPLLPMLVDLLRPGGLMLIRTFSCAGDFPDSGLDPRFVLEEGELLAIFRGWDILLYEEGLEPSSKGGSLAGILARKPI